MRGTVAKRLANLARMYCRFEPEKFRKAYKELKKAYKERRAKHE
jgi:hypothetical protein